MVLNIKSGKQTTTEQEYFRNFWQIKQTCFDTTAVYSE